MLPFTLQCENRPVLVVGGGQVAARRCRGLVEAGALVTVVAPELSPGVLALAQAGRLTWVQRGFSVKDVDAAWLVFALTDSVTVQAEVAKACEAKKTWCSVGGQPALSSFWSMAHTEHEGVTVAVSAGGRPRLAKRLKEKAGEWLRAQSTEIEGG
ncbi:precorrin-2 dehydrogenase/sirohydrochlorin ferrochelatase family protein [Rothia endophytica]|uniref:precorrin-2 dehydrogenase/sirohydrochlorin ferrochelatase family protein n=1 Tax=Rothia endophytica TaxID=1324766 RepID=UPI001F1D2EA4|nr:bifunctional precorrin-2 dehydrogenase/sirohydrochlorin ferrochelatase [Rothia endophytica]